jgi:hypothetical protein
MASKYPLVLSGTTIQELQSGDLVPPDAGGTGVNNGTNIITLTANVSHAGGYTQTFTATGATSITLPTTGTLATLAGSETLSNKTFSGSTTFNNDVTVTGNITINGTTTTINSTTLNVEDKNIELGAVDSPTDTTADGGGITLFGTTNKTFNWSNSTSSWTSSEHIAVAAGKTLVVGGSSSGTTAIAATSAASGTLTLPAATDTLVGKATTDTLTNKTLTAPVITNALITGIRETANVSATAATGTVNFDTLTQVVLYYTTNSSGNFTVNFRGNSSTTLDNTMSTGQSLSTTFLATQGSTAYYNSAVTVDGNSVTPKWQGGTAPTTGNASAVDSYTYVIVKTAANTYTILASQTKFA